MGWGDLFSYVFLHYICPVAGTIAIVILTKILDTVRKRYHLGFLKFLEDILIRDANVAMLAQENKAADAIKKGGDKITGGEKWANALGNLAMQHPNVDTEHLKDVLNATIMSTPGIGPADLPGVNNVSGNAQQPTGPAVTVNCAGGGTATSDNLPGDAQGQPGANSVAHRPGAREGDQGSYTASLDPFLTHGKEDEKGG